MALPRVRFFAESQIKYCREQIKKLPANKKTLGEEASLPRANKKTLGLVKNTQQRFLY
jgi:hypothetical protein